MPGQESVGNYIFKIQVRQDKNKMDKRKEERVEYLLITVKNYISSLKLNSYSLENDLIVFRYILYLPSSVYIVHTSRNPSIPKDWCQDS